MPGREGIVFERKDRHLRLGQRIIRADTLEFSLDQYGQQMADDQGRQAEPTGPLPDAICEQNDRDGEGDRERCTAQMGQCFQKTIQQRVAQGMVAPEEQPVIIFTQPGIITVSHVYHVTPMLEISKRSSSDSKASANSSLAIAA